MKVLMYLKKPDAYIPYKEKHLLTAFLAYWLYVIQLAQPVQHPGKGKEILQRQNKMHKILPRLELPRKCNKLNKK